MSNLMLHAGGRVATLDEVRNVSTPAALGRWHPTAHATVLDSVRETLTGAGYVIRAEKYALARNDARFFGVLDLATPLVQGVSLSVGSEEQHRQRLPARVRGRFSRVFVCDNLAFSAELMVRRKHTLNGMRAFRVSPSGTRSLHWPHSRNWKPIASSDLQNWNCPHL